jgi:hypothetical protein
VFKGCPAINALLRQCVQPTPCCSHAHAKHSRCTVCPAVFTPSRHRRSHIQLLPCCPAALPATLLGPANTHRRFMQETLSDRAACRAVLHCAACHAVLHCAACHAVLHCTSRLAYQPSQQLVCCVVCRAGPRLVFPASSSPLYHRRSQNSTYQLGCIACLPRRSQSAHV